MRVSRQRKMKTSKITSRKMGSKMTRILRRRKRRRKIARSPSKRRAEKSTTTMIMMSPA